MLVQRGVTTLTGVLETVVTLETPVPVGHSWVKVSRKSPDTFDGAHYATCTLDGSVDGNYTQLRIIRGYTHDSTTVHWQVISDKMFSVQHGVSTIADDGTVDVPIAAVDLSQTFVAITYTGTTTYIRILGTRASLPSSNTLRLARGISASTSIQVSWFVVTMQGATVQAGTATMPDTSITATINQIDPQKTFLVFDRAATTGAADGRYNKEHMTLGYFENNTTVKFERFDDQYTGEVIVDYFVVSHPGVNVIAEMGTFLGTEITKGISLDQRYAVGFISSYAEHTSTNKYSEYAVTINIVDDTTISLSRNSDLTQIHFSYFVIEFPAVQPPINLSPNNQAIMPGEDNSFTFELTEAEHPLYQEIEYREVGGSWISTGQQSYSGEYRFPAHEFAVGKHFEWHARYWEFGEDAPSDWSEEATFNTINPVIQRPSPAPNSNHQLGVLDFGLTPQSPLGYALDVAIEISQNEDFTGAVVYNFYRIPAGEDVIVEYAVTRAGIWYVQMTLTDTSGNTSVFIYSFFAGQFLRFTDYPSVMIQAPQATHVTVGVRGTTTRYTAAIMPEPLPENRVERLVWIDNGDVATCQAVAQKLLAKWGREQVSVEGDIPLTVALRFRQRIRVVIPELGINQEMILQKKTHYVTESRTNVTLGDIQLSEAELIARTIDALERSSQAGISALQADIITLGVETSELEITDIEQGQELSDTDIQVIEVEQEVPPSE